MTHIVMEDVTVEDSINEDEEEYIPPDKSVHDGRKEDEDSKK